MSELKAPPPNIRGVGGHAREHLRLTTGKTLHWQIYMRWRIRRTKAGLNGVQLPEERMLVRTEATLLTMQAWSLMNARGAPLHRQEDGWVRCIIYLLCMRGTEGDISVRVEGEGREKRRA